MKNEMDVEEYLCQGNGRDENKDKELTKHRRVEKGFVLFEGNENL